MNNVSLPLNSYSYRIEFQLRGAGHAHGVLYVDWSRFPEEVIPRRQIKLIEEALERIRLERKLDPNHCEAICLLADTVISCSVKLPITYDKMKVQKHRDTKACHIESTGECRFHFPQYPTYKTVVSAPSNVLYEDEVERDARMTRAREILKKVKAVLTDKKLMDGIQAYKSLEMQSMVDANIVRWKIKMICEEGYHVW